MSHSTHPSSGGSPESIAAGHELTDVKVAPLLQFGVMMTVVVVVTMWGVYKGHVWMEKFFSARENAPHPMQSAGSAPVGPKLLVNEAKYLAEFQTGLVHKTTGDGAYMWIDRPQDVVQVPISRAMELVLQEGLPHRPAEKK
ncbi:MAG TPA: hypothetical protein VK843_08805 [Planctomycetota bacterium]|nr:hypothetical protein [Planctomycetota bacterium]